MEVLPKDIRKALNESNIQSVFESLPPSHRREYLKWIEEAKKPETRASRIQKMCQMLQSK
jgi:uncharacterized protein YdeI (YjbR/CyaY-like superfamily)